MEEKQVLYRVKRGDPSVTLADILRMIEKFQKEMPDMDVFWDGDEYAICARKRADTVQGSILSYD